MAHQKRPQSKAAQGIEIVSTHHEGRFVVHVLADQVRPRSQKRTVAASPRTHGHKTQARGIKTRAANRLGIGSLRGLK